MNNFDTAKFEVLEMNKEESAEYDILMKLFTHSNGIHKKDVIDQNPEKVQRLIFLEKKKKSLLKLCCN